MSRRIITSEPKMVKLNVEQMNNGIGRIEKLISEIQEFDIKIIQKRSAPEVKALEASIKGTLTSVFGHNTVEYERYEDAVNLDQGTHVMQMDLSWTGGVSTRHNDAREAQQYVSEGKERSIQLLRTAIKWLQDEIENMDGQPVPIVALKLTEHIGIHPKIQAKCEKLYSSGTFAEAVEKSFKVVRDRLRELTGHETGSEAFGKGKLHIRGSVAQNVDFDFNEGAKFLTMAIDKFRNEKAHTSDAKIDDPARARQYLMLSSLAMSLLDDTEIRF